MVQPLSCSSHETNAPTPSGSDASIAYAATLRLPYGAGTGSATTDGCDGESSRCGANGTYCACSVSLSPVITGAKLALTTR